MVATQRKIKLLVPEGRGRTAGDHCICFEADGGRRSELDLRHQEAVRKSGYLMEWAYRSVCAVIPSLPPSSCLTLASVSLPHTHKRYLNSYPGRLLRMLLCLYIIPYSIHVSSLFCSFYGLEYRSVSVDL